MVCISEHIIIYDEKGRVCPLCPVSVSTYGKIFLKSRPYYWEATIPLLVQVLRADLTPKRSPDWPYNMIRSQFMPSHK